MTPNPEGTNALVWISQLGGTFSLPAKNTKKPIDRNWQKTPHSLPDALEHHLKGGNIGLLTGSKSNGIIAIDIDMDFEEKAGLLDLFSNTTKIFRRNAPGRGKLLYRINPTPKSRAFTLAGEMRPRVELLSDDRHALIPPSIFEGDDYYFVDIDYGIMELDEIDLQSLWFTLTGTLLQPDARRSTSTTQDDSPETSSLIEQLKEYWKTAFQVFEYFGWTEDARQEQNESQWRLPGHGGLIISNPEGPVPWKWFCHSQSVGGDQLDAWNFCQTGEVIDRSDSTTFQRVLREMSEVAGIDPDTFSVNVQVIQKQTFPYTDTGNALRLIHLFGNEIRYSLNRGKWLVWNGKVWEIDAPGSLHHFRMKVIENLKNEALATRDSTLRNEAIAWTISTQSVGHLSAMLTIAQGVGEICVSETDLDRNPWILNCNNGIVDLKTGELKPHDPAEMCTKIVPIDFDPNATCERWDAFLKEILLDRPDMMSFIQQWVGYSLTGVVSEQALCFLHGSGANGKSTFLNILLKLLGDYAIRCPTEMIMFQFNKGSASNDVARLRGARLALTAELEEGRRFSEGVVKDLTGGDSITARYLFQEYFEFWPSHKLWIYGNSKPIIRGTDGGIWRRLHLLPFEASFMGEDRDIHLAEKLVAELPGILAWGIRGCLDWQKKSLVLPEAAKKAINEYRSEMDIIREFIEISLTPGTFEDTILLKDLYRVYSDWFRRENFSSTKMGRTLFYRHLEDRHHFKRYLDSDGMYRYREWKIQSESGLTINFKK